MKRKLKTGARIATINNTDKAVSYLIRSVRAVDNIYFFREHFNVKPKASNTIIGLAMKHGDAVAVKGNTIYVFYEKDLEITG